MFGGGIDEGEDVLTALKRELFEELKLDISGKVVEPLGFYEKTIEQDGMNAEVHVFTVSGVDPENVVIQKEEGGVEVKDFNEAIIEGRPEELLLNPALTRITRLALEDFLRQNP